MLTCHILKSTLDNIRHLYLITWLQMLVETTIVIPEYSLLRITVYTYSPGLCIVNQMGFLCRRLLRILIQLGLSTAVLLALVASDTSQESWLLRSTREMSCLSEATLQLRMMKGCIVQTLFDLHFLDGNCSKLSFLINQYPSGNKLTMNMSAYSVLVVIKI